MDVAHSKKSFIRWITVDEVKECCCRKVAEIYQEELAFVIEEDESPIEDLQWGQDTDECYKVSARVGPC